MLFWNLISDLAGMSRESKFSQSATGILVLVKLLLLSPRTTEAIGKESNRDRDIFTFFVAINLRYWGGQCDCSASVKWAKNHYDIMSQISGRFDQWANQVICVGRSFSVLKIPSEMEVAPRYNC